MIPGTGEGKIQEQAAMSETAAIIPSGDDEVMR